MSSEGTYPTSNRTRPDWMSALDERILELIAIEGNMTPLALSADDVPPRLHTDRAVVAERCSDLCDRGYLVQLCEEIYTLTPTAERFLSTGYGL